MFRLKNWAVVSTSDSKRRLSGTVSNNKSFQDGKKIFTSSIVDVEGRKITTSSGSVYYLDGPPENEYLQWIKEHGYEYDEINPIKVVNLQQTKLKYWSACNKKVTC